MYDFLLVFVSNYIYLANFWASLISPWNPG